MSTPADWRDALSSLLPSDYVPEPEAAAGTAPAQQQKGMLNVHTERKGRAGKVATIISGFTVDNETVAGIASDLRRTLGTGGSARGGEILIQGDRAADVVDALTKMGLKARRV